MRYRWDVPEEQVDKHHRKLKKTKFPAPRYNRKKSEEDIRGFAAYAATRPKLLKGNTIRRSFYGSSLIHPYHPHRWSERTSEDISMTEAWKQPYRMRRAIKLTMGDGKEPTVKNVGGAFRKYKLGRSPAFFSPAQSLAMIDRYSKPGDTVLDPFSGYGGSIPATAVSNRKYVGIDINKKSIRGNRKMARDLRRTLKLPKDQIKLIHGDTRKVLQKMPENSVDFIYTSPPYYNREYYSGKGQSYQLGTYDKWLTDFYEPSLKGMQRVAKPGSTVAINIAPVKVQGVLKYPLDADTVAAAKRLGLHYQGRKKLTLGMYRRGAAGKNLEEQKYEPVLMFKKR